MRVCYFGTYREGYSRNQIMIEGLRRNGVEVVECHVQLWHGIDDRVRTASGGWLRPAFLARLVRTYRNLLRAYRETSDYDVMVLGYPGQLDVFLGRLLTWLRGKPLVLDVFMSIYLIAEERGLTEKHPITARLIYLLERFACALPNLLILDTAPYVAWFHNTYNIKEDRFRLVPTGADDRYFHPVERDKEDGRFRVLYYGTFIPNHGVRYIVEAAKLLCSEPEIQFKLIGEGPTKAEALNLVEEYQLTNVTFEGWVRKHELPHRVGKADVCLGAFGTTPQSMMTVQNKIYEGLAMGKPVITGDSPALRRSLSHKKHLYLCKRANPGSLAEAIRVLYRSPELRKRLREQGHAAFEQAFTLRENGRRFAAHLQILVGDKT